MVSLYDYTAGYVKFLIFSLGFPFDDRFRYQPVAYYDMPRAGLKNGSGNSSE